MVARKLWRHLIGVQARSRALGKPLHNPRRHSWTPEDEKLLRERTDREIARFLGTTLKAVRHRRYQLGIPLGGKQLAQVEVARHAAHAQRRRGGHLGNYTAEAAALLGTMNDSALAARLGVIISAVAHRRRRLGRPVRLAHRRPWTPEEDALLGTVTDSEIAARLGRQLAVVCVRRQKLGIPNFYWQQRTGGRQGRLKGEASAAARKCAKSPLATTHRFCQTRVAMSGLENQFSLTRGTSRTGRPPRNQFPIACQAPSNRHQRPPHLIYRHR
jgi:hypothetical protein